MFKLYLKKNDASITAPWGGFMKFYDIFLKQIKGKSLITWISLLFNALMVALSFYYFGEDKKGLPNIILYPLIVSYIFTLVIQYVCDSYEHLLKPTGVAPQEILTTFYNSLEFEDSDVKMTLYKVLDKPYGKKEIHLIAKLSKGEILNGPMNTFYSRSHLINAINFSGNFKYFELDEESHTGKILDNIGFSPSFIESYSKIPKYWYFQLLKEDRTHNLKLVLVIESLKPIRYLKSQDAGYLDVNDNESAEVLYNKIDDSQLLNSILNTK